MTKPNGFSLIELMIALLLGLLILGGVGSIFVANRQAFRTNDNLARLQENARSAFELMAREVRGADGNPCGTPHLTNVLDNPTTNWWSDWNAGSLIGYDGAQAAGAKAFGTGTAERVTGTDAVLIKSGALGNSLAIVSFPAPTTTSTFEVNRVNHGVGVNDLIMACDAFGAALFAVTASDQVNRTITAPTLPRTFAPGGSISPYTAAFWFIGNNDRGGRSLYRVGTNTIPLEIVEGVTDMQVEYLTRNTATQTLATAYLPATSIANWTDAAADVVVAVRMTLSLESAEGIGTDQAPLFRTIPFVISLRNRENVL